MLESLNRYFAALLATLRSMFSRWILGPFLVLAAVQGLILWLLTIAPSTVFAGWPIEILRYWFNPVVGHYPGHLMLLPLMFFRTSVLVYGFVGIVAYAVATGAFSRRFTGVWGGPRGFVSYTISRFVPLFMIWLVTTVVIFYGISHLPSAFAGWTFGSPRRGIFMDVATRMVVILFMSCWAYTTVALIVDRLSLFNAIKVSVRRFLRHPLATFFLLGVPYAITVPFSLVASRSEYLARQFRPETVIFALILVIISQLVANVIACGSITHYYLGETRPE